MKSNHNPRFTRAILLQEFAQPFVARGGDIQKIMRRNRIPARALSDPNLPVEASACYATLEDMAAELGDPFFCALTAQDIARRGALILHGTATVAATLGEFLIGAVLETDQQFDNVAYSLCVTAKAATFEIKRLRQADRPTPQADAAGVAFYTTILRECLGESFDPDRLIISALSLSGLPSGLLPARTLVRSRDMALSITFPPDWLQTPFRPEWTAEAGRYNPAQAPHPHAPLAFLSTVMRENVAIAGFDLSSLAASCNISTRHLQRLFAANDTTFRSLMDQMRRDTAIGLVTRTLTPLKDVALATGFATEATFCRSYRRWTGTSPGAHRLVLSQMPQGA